MEKWNFIQLSYPKLNFIPLSGKSAVGQPGLLITLVQAHQALCKVFCSLNHMPLAGHMVTGRLISWKKTLWAFEREILESLCTSFKLIEWPPKATAFSNTFQATIPEYADLTHCSESIRNLKQSLPQFHPVHIYPAFAVQNQTHTNCISHSIHSSLYTSLLSLRTDNYLPSCEFLYNCIAWGTAEIPVMPTAWNRLVA